MTEYYTNGLVLDRSPRKELDDAVVLYTKDLGKITAYSKSTKKIGSKLSGHLNIGKLIKMRIVKGNKYKIVDAISENIIFGHQLPKFLGFIDAMTQYEAPDPHLWHGVEYTVKSGLLLDNSNIPAYKIYRRFLEIFGYGAQFARCNNCNTKDVSYFHPLMLIFLCSESLKKLNINEDEAIKI